MNHIDTMIRRNATAIRTYLADGPWSLQVQDQARFANVLTAEWIASYQAAQARDKQARQAWEAENAHAMDPILGLPLRGVETTPEPESEASAMIRDAAIALG